jgi:type II secretory pathway pseudopilin PulG
VLLLSQDNKTKEEKMKKKMLKKRHITLVEMMIVMFLIAMITGVIAYNYTGSLDEGKAFKTKAGIDKIHTVLDLRLATHPEERDDISSKWTTIIDDSQLVKNAEDLKKDGWGIPYTVETDNNGDILIRSQKYDDYQATKGRGSMFNSNQRS